MTRLAALSLVFLLPAAAFAREPDCYARCDNDKKNCEVTCSKGAGKHAASCKSACTQFTDPCRDDCKKKEGRKHK